MGQGDGDLKQLGKKAGDWLHGMADKVQNGDWADKARQEAEKAAGQLGKAGINPNDVGSIAGGVMFPQAAAAKIGIETIGGFVVNKQAKAMLDDPAEVANRLENAFPKIDGNKNNFMEAKEIKAKADGLGGLLDSDRALFPIMGKGYGKFAALDGKDADKGISKDDIELFKKLQNPDAMSSDISSATWKGALIGGAIGALAPLAFGGYKGHIARSLGITAVTGLIGGAWEHHSKSSYFEGKTKEASDLVSWLKQEL